VRRPVDRHFSRKREQCERSWNEAVAGAAEVERICTKIALLLAGRSPEVQGAVLGNLVSMFIAGTHPRLRSWAMEQHVKLVLDLVPESEKEIFGATPTEEFWNKH
jgi:hypothetical protein